MLSFLWPDCFLTVDFCFFSTAILVLWLMKPVLCFVVGAACLAVRRHYLGVVGGVGGGTQKMNLG